MSRKHNWNFLPPRVPTSRPANPSASASPRPPLAQLESLEDRILLSTSDGGTDQILIGLLRSQLNLRNDELNFLKIAGQNLSNDPNQDVIIKFEDDLVKIDGALFKLAHDAFLGNKANTDLQTVKIEDFLVKMETDIKLLGEGAQNLLPAVQKIREAASNALNFINFLPAVQFDGQKLLAGFVKIEHDLFKIGDYTDKFTALEIDGIKGESVGDKLRSEILVKLDDTFLKLEHDLGSFGDGSVFQGLVEDLQAFKLNTLDFLETFGDTGGDIFT